MSAPLIVTDMEKKRKTIVFKHDFPVDVSLVPFIKYSHFSRKKNDKSNEKSTKQQQKNIIIGGKNSNGDAFYELFVDDNDSNSINYESFKKYYNKIFANLKWIGLDGARGTHSYLVQNNKYIVVFKFDQRYNVYDMENDKWMLKQDEKKFKHEINRSVLINDEIIVGSYEHALCFYFIGNDHITNPILIHKYTLKTQHVSFYGHGMCIIDFIKQESSQDKLYQTYKLKIILFGGIHNKDFLSSFLYLDVLLSYQDNKVLSLSINENLIDKKKIKLININQNTINNKRYFHFGFECVFNSKNEPIIIIIGGWDGYNDTIKKDINLFNCVTNELTRYQKVNPLYLVLLYCVLQEINSCVFFCLSIIVILYHRHCRLIVNVTLLS